MKKLTAWARTIEWPNVLAILFLVAALLAGVLTVWIPAIGVLALVLAIGSAVFVVLGLHS
jgi:hypothetical protein